MCPDENAKDPNSSHTSPTLSDKVDGRSVLCVGRFLKSGNWIGTTLIGEVKHVIYFAQDATRVYPTGSHRTGYAKRLSTLKSLENDALS